MPCQSIKDTSNEGSEMTNSGRFQTITCAAFSNHIKDERSFVIVLFPLPCGPQNNVTFGIVKYPSPCSYPFLIGPKFRTLILILFIFSLRNAHVSTQLNHAPDHVRFRKFKDLDSTNHLHYNPLNQKVLGCTQEILYDLHFHFYIISFFSCPCRTKLLTATIPDSHFKISFNNQPCPRYQRQ